MTLKLGRRVGRGEAQGEGHVWLESTGVSDGAKRETVQTSKDAEIGKGVSNLRSVKCSMANDGRIGRGVSNGRQPVMLESEMKELAAPWMGAVPTPPIGNKSQA